MHVPWCWHLQSCDFSRSSSWWIRLRSTPVCGESPMTLIVVDIPFGTAHVASAPGSGIVIRRREASRIPAVDVDWIVAPRQRAPPEAVPKSSNCAGGQGHRASEVDSPLIAPDLALDRLHLIVPDGSDAMVVLEAWANGSQPGADPRTVFAERIGEVGHVSVSFGDEDPIQLRLDLPDLVLQCVAQAGPDGTREHLGLRVLSIRPTGGQPEGARSEERRVGKEGR